MSFALISFTASRVSISKLPPLRERLEDIIPLAEHFFRQAHENHKVPELDPAVREYLLRREYPGNVRELQQVVFRLMCRCAADATLPLATFRRMSAQLANRTRWFGWIPNSGNRSSALLSSVPALKDIGRAAEEVAIQYATDVEDGSSQRAARRLGVTDRALQIWRAHRRET